MYRLRIVVLAALFPLIAGAAAFAGSDTGRVVISGCVGDASGCTSGTFFDSHQVGIGDEEVFFQVEAVSELCPSHSLTAVARREGVTVASFNLNSQSGPSSGSRVFSASPGEVITFSASIVDSGSNINCIRLGEGHFSVARLTSQ